MQPSVEKYNISSNNAISILDRIFLASYTYSIFYMVGLKVKQYRVDQKTAAYFFIAITSIFLIFGTCTLQ